MSLNDPELDAQHRRLLDLANSLGDAVQMGADGLVIDRVLEELSEYAAGHFREEELYMERVEFPDRSTHMAAHEKFAEQVEAYRAERSRGEDVDPNQLVLFMRNWLINHIVYQDTDIAKYVRRLKMAGGFRSKGDPQQAEPKTAMVYR